MRFALGFLLILTLLHAATISGSIYSYDSFEKVGGAVVKFEGKSSQQIISEDGDYSIDLEKGEYNITAFLLKNGTLRYYTKEKISVGEGNQTFDLVLFEPSFFESDELPNLDLEIQQKKEDWILYIIGAAALAIAAFLLTKKCFPFVTLKKESGEEEMKVLHIIKENEGRMEQKQLRDILKFSESKMSLLLTELEVGGYIKRFKKGRENIIKLKKTE